MAACGLLLAIAGCGGGVSSGATVSAYFGAPLCAGAKRELAQAGGRAGDIEVRVVCLSAPERGRRVDLAAVGENARSATEDSSSVAYLEAPGPANRFSRPILEEAGIAWTTDNSGAKAMQRLLQAIEAADSGSLRESVHDALDQA
jgi:hypothetical protein